MFKRELEKYVCENFEDIESIRYARDAVIGRYSVIESPWKCYYIRYVENLAEDVFNIISRKNYTADKDLEGWAVHLTHSNCYLDDIVTADHLGKMLFLLSTGKLPEDALKDFSRNQKVDFWKIFKDIKARYEIEGEKKLHKIVFDYDKGIIDVDESIKLSMPAEEVKINLQWSNGDKIGTIDVDKPNKNNRVYTGRAAEIVEQDWKKYTLITRLSSVIEEILQNNNKEMSERDRRVISNILDNIAAIVFFNEEERD